jgi:hypothetical protein
MGLFLSGLYYAVKDSINPDTMECYMTTPAKFIENYEHWYEVAQDKLEMAKNKKSTKLKSLD